MNSPRLIDRIYCLLEPGEHGHRGNLVLDRLVIFLILLNVAAVIVESFSGLPAVLAQLLRIVEVVSVAIFTAEYAGRIATAHLKMKRQSVVRSVLAFIVTPMALVDLAAILPFYLPFIVTIDLRFLRILRLTRLLRVLKINRYTSALSIIGRVLKDKASQLVVTVFVTVLLLLLSASVMYYIETDEQPEQFPNIVAAFWWAVATLTTVGYGDVYPVTGLGKLLAGIIAVLGVGLVALPAGILSSGFLEDLQESEQTKRLSRRRQQTSPRTKAYHRRHAARSVHVRRRDRDRTQ